MFPSFSRAFIFDTTFLRSSTTAEARGSIVLITQLDDVCSFSAYLDRSDAKISMDGENHNKKVVCLYVRLYDWIPFETKLYLEMQHTHEAKESSAVELHTQSRLQVHSGENAAKRNIIVSDK